MLDKKLQLKEGQTIAVLGAPSQPQLAASLADPEVADAVLIYATNEATLQQHFGVLRKAADNGKLTWVAYPKAKQLNTDINRDIIRDLANQKGLDPVRQIAIDDTWSAMRFKPL